MPLTLTVTDTGALVTACCRVTPWGRSPFTPPHRTITATDAVDDVPLRNGWRGVTTPAELDALKSWGPWSAIRCFLCDRSQVIY